MQFTDEQINKFSELYESHFGKKLERKVAFEYAEKLFRMIELTYQQISVADVERLEKRREQIKDLNI